MLIILQLQQSLIKNKVVKKCKRALSILKVLQAQTNSRQKSWMVKQLLHHQML